MPTQSIAKGSAVKSLLINTLHGCIYQDVSTKQPTKLMEWKSSDRHKHLSLKKLTLVIRNNNMSVN